MNLCKNLVAVGFTLLAGLGSLSAVEPMLAVGNRHSLYLADDGTVWAWGDNSNGQLGDGTSSDSLVPKQVSGLSGVIQIAAGYEFSMALDKDGSVHVWGDDTYGQIGDGTVGGGNQLTPRVATGSVKQIAAGGFHCLALSWNGAAYAWGYNATGACGNGGTSNLATPTAVNGSHTFRELAGGGLHSLGLRSDGLVFSWGYNSDGQLGLGSTGTNQTTPQQITSHSNIKTIGAGYYHSLFIISGSVYGFGDNSSGQIGNNSIADVNVPTYSLVSAAVRCGGGINHSWAVRGNGALGVWGDNSQAQTRQTAGSPGFQLTVMNYGSYRGGALGPAANHVAVIGNGGGAQESAAVYAWGDNSFGQLGNNATADTSASEVRTHALWPVSGIIAVAQGQYHTQGLASDGRVWSWGQNALGQSGDGSGNTFIPSPVVAANVVNAIGISAGHDFGDHSLAVTGTGTIWAWGANGNGQIGDSTTGNATTPVGVPNGSFPAVQVAAGDYHSLSLHSNGTVRSWGKDSNGQLGNDSTLADQSSPVAVSGSANIVKIAAGSYHSLALHANGTVYAWGQNTFGQLGDGTTTERPTPVQIGGLSGVIDIVAGTYHSLALLANGEIRAWGYNAYGQLGDGTTTTSTTPVTVLFSAGASKIFMRQVAAGRFHSMGVDVFGNTWVWGSNFNGELGINSTTNQSYANTVVSGDHLALDGGYRTTVLLRHDGTITGCGNNSSFQIGTGTSSGDELVPIATSATWLPTVQILSGASVTTASETGPSHGAIRISRSGSTAGSLSVDISLSGSASAGSDFSNPGTSLSIPWSQATADLPITVINDAIDEDDETATATLASAINRYQLGATTGLGVTIADNDTAGIIVSPTSGLTTTEAGGTAAFTIKLATQPAAGTVTVNLSSSNPGEGTISPGFVSFNASTWATAQTITITGQNDPVDDDNIAYSITTAAAIAPSDPKYAGLNAEDVSVTNTDNDTAGITVTPTSGLTVTEAGGTATFTITLNTRPTQPVQVGLSSNDATEGSVSPGSANLDGSNWNTGVLVTVTGIDDSLDDGNIAFTVVTAAAASSDPKYNGLNASDVSVSCTDNDASGLIITETSGSTSVTEGGATDTYTVRLASQPTGPVTVALSSLNSEASIAPTSINFTTSNWNTAVTITVTAVDDNDIENPAQNDSIVHDPSGADYADDGNANLTILVTDNDVAGATVSPTTLTITENQSASFQVALTAKPGGTVVIRCASTDTATASLSSDPRDLHFGPSATGNGSGSDGSNLRLWSNALAVSVLAVDDGDSTNDAATIVLTLQSTADSNFSGINPSDVSITNQDDDTPGLRLTQSDAATAVTEGGTTDTYDVRLTTDPGNAAALVVVSITASSGVSVSPSTLVFTGSGAGLWSTNQTVTVTATNDAVDEAATASVTLTHAIQAASSATGYSAGMAGIPSLEVEVTDNDTAAVIISPITGLITTEAGGQATFAIRLASEPTTSVTIDLASSDTSEAGHPSDPVFDASNWSTPQTVIVTGADDDLDDGEVGYVITGAITAGGTDANYLNISIPTVSGSTLDNDAVGITVATGDGVVVTEAGTTDTYSIALTAQPSGPVQISIAPDGQVTTSSNALYFGPAATGSGSGADASNLRLWSNTASITVAAVNDDVDETATHAATITHAASGSDYSGVAAAAVALSITDNDSAGFTIGSISGTVSEALDGATSDRTSTGTNGTTGVVQFAVGTDLSSHFVGQILVYGTGSANAGVQTIITAVNDAADTITVLGSDVVDGGAESIAFAAGFSVSLTSQPLATVQVSWASDDASEAFATPTILTFTTTDWNAPQIVHVIGEDDDLDDGNIAFEIDGGTTASLDPSYNGLVPSSVAVSCLDDDVAAITIDTAGGVVTTEAGGIDSFTIVLASQPAADVTIALNSSDLDQGSVNPTSITFTPSTWNTPQMRTPVRHPDGEPVSRAG